MKIEIFEEHGSTEELKLLASEAFSSGDDADMEKWFSFTEMIEAIKSKQGVCLKAVDKDGTLVGFVYAQQESRINGREGVEKWVIVITAVKPSMSGRGIGTLLLEGIEKEAKNYGALKMFVYTNKGDDKVVNFYKKNSYLDAGWIKDYQYGKDNSAVFLLKHLS